MPSPRIAAISRALRGLLRRAADPLPPTALGLLLAGLSAYVLFEYGYARMDVVLLVVGWAGLGLVGTSVLLVSVAALALKLGGRPRATHEPLRMETRRLTPTGFSVASLRFVPLLQVRASIERPEGIEVALRPARGRLHEQVRTAGRGEVRGLRRRIVVQDALGLARVAFRWDDPRVLEVLPSAGGLARMPVLVSLAGGDELPHPMGVADGDRVELRRYVPGDPARHIHWKVYGRTRKLMVRVPERALTRSRRTVAYLVAGPDDDASAAAARVAIDQDALGGEWTFCADGAAEPTSTPQEALAMVVRSSAARALGGVGLAGFVARAERSGPASLVVFAPPAPGPWLDRVLAVARGRAGRVRVVIGVDGLASRAAPPLWRRLLLAPAPRGASSAEGLEEVLRRLGALRCDVLVFDRPTGRRLGGAHLRASVGADARRAA